MLFIKNVITAVIVVAADAADAKINAKFCLVQQQQKKKKKKKKKSWIVNSNLISILSNIIAAFEWLLVPKSVWT